MRLSLVIFNWNYGHFLSELLISLKPLINSPDVNIFILDDGSTDNSIEMIDSFFQKNSPENIKTLRFNINNTGRSYPSFGQLLGLRKLLDSQKDNVNDLIWLMDADDLFNYEEFKKLRFNFGGNEEDVYFLKMIDVIENSEFEYKIKRKIKRWMSIWPSVSPTSSIIIRKSFLETYQDEIFNFNEKFSDVWLDARINLVCIFEANVKYLPVKVYRNLHGNNDSLKSDFYRTIKKQLQSYRYMKFIGIKMKLNSFRLVFLRLIDAVCK